MSETVEEYRIKQHELGRDPGYGVRFQLRNHKYRAKYYYDPNDKLDAISLHAGKSESEMDHITRDGSTIMSMAIQAGVSPHKMLASMTKDEDGKYATAFGLALEKALSE